MAERKPLRFLNPDGSPEAIGLPSGYPSVHCSLIAPIASLASVYGWVCLIDKLGADEFSAEDERILAILAAQVGRIYENGILYVQVERRAAELQAEAVERKRAEEALLESEKRFRQMAENIREVFWLTDPAKNQILYVSPAYEEIWGRSCESVYASPREWMDAIHPEDRERVLQAARTKRASGEYVEDSASSGPTARSDGYATVRSRSFATSAKSTGSPVLRRTSPSASKRLTNFAGARTSRARSLKRRWTASSP